MLANNLLIADVVHKRLQPKENAFRYKVYYLCVPLSALKELARVRLLSVNRFNLFSLKEKDYGLPSQPNRAGESESYIRALLKEHGITAADGEIVLQTLPRLVGYAFNPVSFWFCLDKAGKLRAVVNEVNNTFGERHIYVVAHKDGRVIQPNDWLEKDKVFHVSPFMRVEGRYRFRYIYTEEKTAVWIDYATEEGDMLVTSVIGKRKPLTTRNLLYCFLRYPLVTAKVIGLIHYQALKLVAKGIKYIPKPTPPKDEVT